MFIVLILVSAMSGYIAKAQDDKLDSLDFNLENPPEAKKPPYFAIAGGYTGTLLWVNFDDVNAHFGKNFGLDDMKAPMYMSGAQGFTAIGIIPNVRLGFFGMGGSKLKEATMYMNSDTVKRSLNYSVSFNGISIDWAYIPWKSVAIIPGISFGWGNMIIENYQAQTSGYSWNNIKPSGDTINYLNRAETTYSFLQPNINVEFAVTPFFALRLNAGYATTFSLFGSSWKYNVNAALNNVPPKITASGMTLQFGIFLGLFNY